MSFIDLTEQSGELRELAPTPAEATESYQDPRIKAVVVLDPAAGPGYSEASLAKVRVPVLVIGCEDNDFLPFEHHAGRYAALLPNASLIKLNEGEGHFVFLNSCTSDLSANGCPCASIVRGWTDEQCTRDWHQKF